MMKIAFTVLALFALTAQAAIFRDCGSSARLTDVRVPGCTNPPCIVKRGTNVTLNFDFTSNDVHRALDVEVTGDVSGLGVLPWPGTFDPPCTTFTVGDCPLEVNENLTQENVLVIASAWPAVSATAKWRIIDTDKNVDVVCFQVPVTLI